MLIQLFSHSITLLTRCDVPNLWPEGHEYPRAGCARLPPRRMLCHQTK
jgi:hypothetical protein